MAKNLKRFDKVMMTTSSESVPIVKEELQVMKLDRATAIVRDDTGFELNVHKARIKKVTDNKENTMSEEKKTEKKTPKAKKSIPFDLNVWKNHHGGGVVLRKSPSAIGPRHESIPHLIINEDNGFYCTVNVIRNTDSGDLTLGKKTNMGTKYPLKGNTLQVGNGSSKSGTKTAKEIAEQYEKNGYQKI